MSGLTLFRRRDQPQALIQAPSAELIKPDTAPELPKMVEIECKLSPEELAKYLEAIDNTRYRNLQLNTECLRHLLRKLGDKQYLESDIFGFVEKSINYFRKKEGTVWLERVRFHYVDSHAFLPPRIINKITKIRNGFPTPDDLEFIILGIRKVPSRTWLGFFLEVRIAAKRKTAVELYFDDAGQYSQEDELTCFIIDAWRGPTFSDEESYLPGQEKT